MLGKHAKVYLNDVLAGWEIVMYTHNFKGPDDKSLFQVLNKDD